MKKIFALILVCVFAFSAMPTVTLAAVPEQISPMWTNTMAMTADLTFDGARGNVVVTITGHSGVNNIVASIKLYYKNLNGVWTELNFNWNYDIDDQIFAVHETFVATRGYEYKVDIVATLTKNGVEETITKTITGTCPPRT